MTIAPADRPTMQRHRVLASESRLRPSAWIIVLVVAAALSAACTGAEQAPSALGASFDSIAVADPRGPEGSPVGGGDVGQSTPRRTNDDLRFALHEIDIADHLSGERSAANLLGLRDPSVLCVDDRWREAVKGAVDRLGIDVVSLNSTPTGRGCRVVVASAAGREVDMRIELLNDARLEEVVTSRRTAEGDVDGLMGFRELGLVVSVGRISSSLFHDDIDRSEEYRWIELPIGEREAGRPAAVHVALAIEPLGSLPHTAMVDATEVFAASSVALVDAWADANAVVDPPSDDGVDDTASVVDAQQALFGVIDAVRAGVPLGTAATPRGAEAIAFEYAFPQNLAAIASYRDDVVCHELASGVECTITALRSVYRFGFVSADDRWLLDDFVVEA